MQRRVIIFAGTLLAVLTGVVGGMMYAVHRGDQARLGPVYRYAAAPGEQFLTEQRAVAIARDVMNRDGFPESAWTMMDRRDRGVLKHALRCLCAWSVHEDIRALGEQSLTCPSQRQEPFP